MLRLVYRSGTTIPVEAECLTPDQLTGKSVTEIQALPVQHGERGGCHWRSSSRSAAAPTTASC